MEKVVRKTKKYLTENRFERFENSFDGSMRAIAKSFADNAEVTAGILTQLKNINEVTTIILKEIRTIHEDNKYFRASISNLNADGLSYDRKIEDLDVRVEKLELKSK